MPATSSPICQPMPRAAGSTLIPQFIHTPINTMLLTVPRPGHWRSGIHSSSTAAPTSTTTVPIARPR